MSYKKKVCYFHDYSIGEYYYGPGHPMKPHRLQITHNLVLSYNLYKKMEVFRPHHATDEEMMLFHSPEYIDFMRRVTPDTQQDFAKQLQRFNGEDCPVFDGLYDYCRIYTGGSIDGAMKLNHGTHKRGRRPPRPARVGSAVLRAIEHVRHPEGGGRRAVVGRRFVGVGTSDARARSTGADRTCSRTCQLVRSAVGARLVRG